MAQRLIGRLPKVGIRPVIDGREGGIRESLEGQTMDRRTDPAWPTKYFVPKTNSKGPDYLACRILGHVYA